MSTDCNEPTVTIEEVRAAVLKLESQAKPEEQAAAEPESKKPEPPKKREYEPSEHVRRTQKIIEAIDQRHEERAKLVATKLRREVEISTELRQAQKDRDARLEAVEAAARERLAAIAGAFEDLGHERAGELTVRDLEISKLDASLDQLRKQLDAELGKMGAKVPA